MDPQFIETATEACVGDPLPPGLSQINIRATLSKRLRAEKALGFGARGPVQISVKSSQAAGAVARPPEHWFFC